MNENRQMSNTHTYISLFSPGICYVFSYVYLLMWQLFETVRMSYRGLSIQPPFRFNKFVFLYKDVTDRHQWCMNEVQWPIVPFIFRVTSSTYTDQVSWRSDNNCFESGYIWPKVSKFVVRGKIKIYNNYDYSKKNCQ